MESTRACVCSYCGVRFDRPVGGTRILSHEFCNLTCSSRFQRSRVTVPCGQCGCSVTRATQVLKNSKSGHLFCNHTCAARYTNTHKTWGCRRSKLEVWLEEQLRKSYPDLDLHCNRTDAIQGELDFYFPSLKLAFELNGILHYEPIYGVDNLARSQSNDARKMLACAEREIELCVIDSSGFKNFKPKGAEKFLTLIRDVVDRVLIDRVAAGWAISSKDPMRGRGMEVRVDVIKEPRVRVNLQGEPKPKPEPTPHFRASRAFERVLVWDARIREGDTQSGIARREGICRVSVTQMMKMLQLSESIKQKLLARDPSVGHLTVKDAIRQIASGTDI